MAEKMASDYDHVWCLALALVALLFVFFFKTNHVFQYYVKLVAFLVNFLIIGAISVPFAVWRPWDPATIRPFQYWWRFSLRRTWGVKVVKRNTKAFESCNEAAILIVNHQSFFDMTGVFEVSPYRATFLAKKLLLYSGTFGLGAWLCGMIFIDRLNAERSRKTMDYTVSVLKNKKVKIWVFPEGTRNMNGSLLEFKKGAFHLAVQAQVPIYPVVFSSYRHFMDSDKRISNPGKVIVSGLPPVPTAGLTAADVPELTNRVRESMLAEFLKISEEVQTEARLNRTSLLAE